MFSNTPHEKQNMNKYDKIGIIKKVEVSDNLGTTHECLNYF